MARWRRTDPAAVGVLAELDHIIAGLRAAGLDNWAAGAEWTAAWVRDNGVDSVVDVRLQCYRTVLAAATV